MDELGGIGEALAEVDREGAEPPGFILLIRLLAVTGMRLGGALTLRWSDVDLARRTIRLLRDAKGGARTVYLSPR
jgi:integrase